MSKVNGNGEKIMKIAVFASIGYISRKIPLFLRFISHIQSRSCEHIERTLYSCANFNSNGKNLGNFINRHAHALRDDFWFIFYSWIFIWYSGLVINVFCPIIVGLSWDPIWVKIQPVVQTKIMMGRRPKVNIFRQTGTLRWCGFCCIWSSLGYWIRQ